MIKILGTRGEIEESSPNHKRYSGILIDNVLFDIGEKEYLKLNPKAIIVTHLHPDHAYFTRKKKEEHPELRGKLLYLPEKWDEFKENHVPIIYKKLENFVINGMKITPIPTVHSKKVKSYGMLIRTRGKKIFYSADMIWIRKRHQDLIRNADLVITEGSTFDRDLIRRDKKTGEIYGHSKIPKLVKFFKRLGAKKIGITHFGRWLVINPREGYRKIKKLSNDTKVWALKDGETIDLESLQLKTEQLPKETQVTTVKFPSIYCPINSEHGPFRSDKELKKHLLKVHPEEAERWIKLLQLSKKPKTGLYLVPPHGRWIAEGKKTLIVKSKKFKEHINEPLYLIEDGFVYGIISLKEPREIDSEEFRKLREKHRVSDKEAFEKWGWEEDKPLYAYEFEIIELFKKPKKVKIPQGVQVFVNAENIEFLSLEELIANWKTYDPMKLIKTKANRRVLADDHRIVHTWWNRLIKGKRMKSDQFKSFSLEEQKKIVKELHRKIVEAFKALNWRHRTPLGEQLISPSKIQVKDLEMIDPPLLKGLSDKQLKELYYRLHWLYHNVLKRITEPLQNAHNFVFNELKYRNVRWRRVGDRLDRVSERIIEEYPTPKGFASAETRPEFSLDELVKERSLSEILEKFPDLIVLKEDPIHVYLCGGIVNRGKALPGHDIDILFKQSFPDARIIHQFVDDISVIDKDLGRRLHFVWDPFGPTIGMSVPLYRLAFKKVSPSEMKRKSPYEYLAQEIKVMRPFRQLKPKCYTEDTEVLTRNGWKKIGDVTLEDEVATLRNGYWLSWKKPLRKFEYDWNGKIVHFVGDYIDLKVTPEHQMYVKRGFSRKWEMCEASELINEFFRIKRNMVWETKGKLKEFLGMDGNDFLYFLGTYLAEGHCRHRKTGGWEIKLALYDSQWEKEIESLLAKYQIKVHRYKEGELTFWSEKLGKYLIRLGKARNKFIPKEFKNLERDQLFWLFKGLYGGDGARRFQRFTSSSKQLAEDFMELALKLGYSSHIYERGGEFYVYFGSRHRPRVNQTKLARLEDYSGKVYCLEVPNHVLFVRRNGKPLWSGNSGFHKFEFFDVQEFWDKWASKVIDKGLIVQKKYDGLRFQIHLKGDQIKIITEDKQRDRAWIFKKSVAELLKKKTAESFILDAEMVEYNCFGKKVKDKEEFCQALKREEMIPWVTVTERKLDDENVVFHVHDCLYFNGEDIHEKGYVERWNTIDKCFPPGLEHWRKVPGIEVNDMRGFFKAVKKERSRPGSEGVVVKIKDSIYKLTGRTGDWCLTGGSWILTENGLEQIAYIKPGTRVFSKDGKLHRVLKKSKRKITRKESLFEIGDYHGIKVRATGWHEVLLNPGEWVPTFDAKSAPVIPRLQIPFEKKPENLVLNWHGYTKKIKCNEDFWRMIGFWIAEGSLGNNRNKNYKRGELEFSQKDPKTFNKYAELFDEILKVKGRRYSYNGLNYYQVWDKPFCNWLSQNFLDKNDDKTIPWFIASLSNKELDAFLEGWKEGDACKERGRISTSDRGLAGRIYAILNSRGKEVAIHYKKCKGARDSFRIQELKHPSHKLVKRRIYTDYKDIVYDLEIENEDSFMTPNLVLHNSKMKNLKEIDVMVWDVEQKKTKEGRPLQQWIYYPVFKVPCGMKGQIKENQFIEWKGKCYARLGRTYSTKVKAKRGDIITIRPVQIVEHKDPRTGKLFWAWMFPLFEALRPDKKEPDTITTVRRIVKMGTGPMPEQLERDIIIRLPHCPYWNDPSICPLRERFWVPRDTEDLSIFEEYLKFPIVCKFANRFRCRFVKDYYYDLRPLKELKENEVEYFEEE